MNKKKKPTTHTIKWSNCEYSGRFFTWTLSWWLNKFHRQEQKKNRNNSKALSIVFWTIVTHSAPNSCEFSAAILMCANELGKRVFHVCLCVCVLVKWKTINFLWIRILTCGASSLIHTHVEPWAICWSFQNIYIFSVLSTNFSVFLFCQPLPLTFSPSCFFFSVWA